MPILDTTITFTSLITTFHQLDYLTIKAGEEVVMFCDTGRIISPTLHQLYWYWLTEQLYGNKFTPFYEAMNAGIIQERVLQAILHYKKLMYENNKNALKETVMRYKLI